MCWKTGFGEGARALVACEHEGTGGAPVVVHVRSCVLGVYARYCQHKKNRAGARACVSACVSVRQIFRAVESRTFRK